MHNKRDDTNRRWRDAFSRLTRACPRRRQRAAQRRRRRRCRSAAGDSRCGDSCARGRCSSRQRTPLASRRSRAAPRSARRAQSDPRSSTASTACGAEGAWVKRGAGARSKLAAPVGAHVARREQVRLHVRRRSEPAVGRRRADLARLAPHAVPFGQRAQRTPSTANTNHILLSIVQF